MPVLILFPIFKVEASKLGWDSGVVGVKDVCRQFGRRDKNMGYDARSRYNLSRRLWLFSALLILAVIPAIALVPQARSGDYGGGKTTDTTSSTSTGMQTTMAQGTSVPEGIDPLLPILLVVGFLSLFHYRRKLVVSSR